jgi:multidrug resistance efflux pump
MNHTDTPAALALRRSLRALAQDEAPSTELWGRIAVRLAPASAPAATSARARWRTPWPALAAALLLGVGLALLLPQALRSRALAQHDVAGLRTLQTALLQLDQAQASLGAAQRAQPQAAFINELRVQTGLQRAAIERRLLGG